MRQSYLCTGRRERRIRMPYPAVKVLVLTLHNTKAAALFATPTTCQKQSLTFRDKKTSSAGGGSFLSLKKGKVFSADTDVDWGSYLIVDFLTASKMSSASPLWYGLRS